MAPARQRAGNWRRERGGGCRRWPRTRRGVALLVGGLLALAVIAPVAAAELLRDGSPRVEQGETVEEDLYVMGGDVEIAGTLTRDLIVMSGELTITDTGRVDGNVNAMVGEAELNGTVGRSVRILGGTVEVFGVIRGDLVVAGGEVTVAPGASILGDVIAAGGDVEILGDVGGDVRVNSGNVVVDAAVAGDVRIDGDDVELGENARIGGELDYTSESEAEIDDAAAVAGDVDRDEPDLLSPGTGVFGWLLSPILHALWLLVAGAVLILLLPRGCVAVANGVRHRPFRSIVVGLLLTIFAPLLIVILLVTVIGLPIGLIGLGAYLAALYLSQVFVGLALGRFILPNAWGDEGRGFNLLAMTLGVLILAGLRLIPVPFVDWAIGARIAVIGLGAIVVGSRRRTPPVANAYGYQP
jgi:hypothetical protein